MLLEEISHHGESSFLTEPHSDTSSWAGPDRVPWSRLSAQLLLELKGTPQGCTLGWALPAVSAHTVPPRGEKQAERQKFFQGQWSRALFSDSLLLH